MKALMLRIFTRKEHSLRSFITLAISFTVTAILLCSTFFYYYQTSLLLRGNFEQSITGQLNQVNQNITEQVDTIDSTIPLFLSNTMLLNALETSSFPSTGNNSRFQLEKQMSDIYYSTPLSGRNFTDAIYIACDGGTILTAYTSASASAPLYQGCELLESIDPSDTGLLCRTLDSEKNSIYFARNLFSGNTGNHMGVFIIHINLDKWVRYCAKGLDPFWFICLYNQQISAASDQDMIAEKIDLRAGINLDKGSVSFQELSLDNRAYFAAARSLDEFGLVSVVAAPKDLLLADLDDAMKSYLLLLALTVVAALLISLVISQAITRPIDKMIYYINRISTGQEKNLPPMEMYHEFDVWAQSFNQMLQQLDIYYNDNFQKQLLLKNAEIRALQSQMNPHFLFNVLNTIAWKAQIHDNEEIYQMVISLGELLKMNTLSKEKDFIALDKEMEYVRFYLYLQQMRFEDKITCHIQIPDHLMKCRIPCFCIQPLVENAVVHGLEPKKGKGRLIIQVIETDQHEMEISIIDNGIGFAEIPDISKITSSGKDTHTHIGLRNLDKRLELLFGSTARLRIESEPNICTSVSMRIPVGKEEDSIDLSTIDRR